MTTAQVIEAIRADLYEDTAEETEQFRCRSCGRPTDESCSCGCDDN